MRRLVDERESEKEKARDREIERRRKADWATRSKGEKEEKKRRVLEEARLSEREARSTVLRLRRVEAEEAEMAVPERGRSGWRRDSKEDLPLLYGKLLLLDDARALMGDWEVESVDPDIPTLIYGPVSDYS